MNLMDFKGSVTRSKTKKRIFYFILSFSLIISLFLTSYAIYKMEKTNDLSNTKVGPFKVGDVSFAVFVDNVKQNDFPTKSSGKVFEKIVCTNSGNGTFDVNTWTLSIDGINHPTECSVYFKTKQTYTVHLTLSSGDTKSGIHGVVIIDDVTYSGAGTSYDIEVAKGSVLKLQTPCMPDKIYIYDQTNTQLFYGEVGGLAYKPREVSYTFIGTEASIVASGNGGTCANAQLD